MILGSPPKQWSDGAVSGMLRLDLRASSLARPAHSIHAEGADGLGTHIDKWCDRFKRKEEEEKD